MKSFAKQLIVAATVFSLAKAEDNLDPSTEEAQ